MTGPGNVYADPKVSGGGQGHLQVTHSAAAMFFISGLQPERVSAFMENWDVPVDLVDAITVKCKPVDGGSAVAVLGSTGNMCAPCGTHFEVRVYCENGHVVLDQATGTVFARNHDGTEEIFGPLPPEELYPRFAPLNNLVDVILGRGENGSPASIGVTVVEMLDAAYRSAEDGGRPVSVAEGAELARRVTRMELSLTGWSFPLLSLEEAAGVGAALGFTAMDWGAYPGGHLDREAILGDPKRSVKRLRETDMLASNLYWTFGAGIQGAGTEQPGPGGTAPQRRGLQAGCRLLRRGRHPVGHAAARRPASRPEPGGGDRRPASKAAANCWRSANRRASRSRSSRT